MQEQRGFSCLCCLASVARLASILCKTSISITHSASLINSSDYKTRSGLSFAGCLFSKDSLVLGTRYEILG